MNDLKALSGTVANIFFQQSINIIKSIATKFYIV